MRAIAIVVLLAVTIVRPGAAEDEAPTDQASLPLPFSDVSSSFAAASDGTIALEATQESTKAVAKVAYAIGDVLVFGKLSSQLEEGQTEVSLTSLDELTSPTVGTVGLSYEIARPVPDATDIEAECQEFRKDLFDDIAGAIGTFDPILIEAGQCRMSELESRSGGLAAGAARALGLKLNALCDAYNSKHGRGRLLATRPNDGVTPLVFETGAETLSATFGPACTEENLIAVVRSDAAAAAEEGKGVEAADAAEKEVLKALRGELLPYCTRYNDHAYQLLRRLEPEGAVPPRGNVDRGCDDESKQAVLADSLVSTRMRDKWTAKLAKKAVFRFWSITASFSGGKQDFKIFSPTSFDPASAVPIADATSKISKTSQSTSVGATYFSRSWSVGGSFMRKRDIKAPTKTQICVPIEGSLSEQCFSALIASPVTLDSDIASVEGKLFLFSSLGLHLRILRDLDKNETEPHVGLYFLRKDGVGLAGGIDLYYDNDADHIAGKVFVGAAFGIGPE